MLRKRGFRRRAVWNLDRGMTETEDEDNDINDDEKLELDFLTRNSVLDSCGDRTEAAVEDAPRLELKPEDEDEEDIDLNRVMTEAEGDDEEGA